MVIPTPTVSGTAAKSQNVVQSLSQNIIWRYRTIHTLHVIHACTYCKCLMNVEFICDRYLDGSFEEVLFYWGVIYIYIYIYIYIPETLCLT